MRDREVNIRNGNGDRVWERKGKRKCIVETVTI